MEQHEQKYWWMSLDISSAEEYDQVTSRLAAELLVDNTPEEMAKIAATHMMYVNALEKLIAEQRNTSEVRKEIIALHNSRLQHLTERSENSIPLESAVRYAKSQVVSWRKEQTQRRMLGLQSRNEAKSVAIARAQTIANKLWQADTAQKIRIGEMADKVYGEMATEGFTEVLPETVESLKKWIKTAAPGYAREGGRRRKTP
tara:strand:+ start:1982 stop:2584 length:603 start_codon:yes stop_codon:yes gene_type:complete